MRIATFVVVMLGSAFACTRERPPPRVCETPLPQKKKETRIGTCPIDWSKPDAAPDASEDAPHDG